MKLLFLIPLYLTIPTSLLSQGKLSLNACLNYGAANNISINTHEIYIAKSKEYISQNNREYLPEINSEYNHFYTQSRTLNTESYSWSNTDLQQGNLAISANLVVFQGLYRLYSKKASSKALEFSKLSMERNKLYLGLDIIISFYKVSLLLESIELLNNTFEQTQSEINKLQEQINAGTLPKSSLYEIQAQAKKESVSIKNLQADLIKQYNKLKELINWQEPYNLIIEPTSELLFPHTIDDETILNQTITSILSKSVVVEEKNANIEIGKYHIKKQKSAFYPTLSANASLSSQYLINAISPIPDIKSYQYRSQLSDNHFKQVGVTLSIPILNRYRNKSNIKLLKLDLSVSGNEKEQAILSLNTALQNIKAAILSLSERIVETTEMSVYYQKSFEVVQEKYKAGLLDSYSLNIAKNNYIKAKLEKNKLILEQAMNYELLKHYNIYLVN